MREQLQEFLARQWPDADEIVVEEFAVIAGGYSRETFRFDAHVTRSGKRVVWPMILRKDPPPAVGILHTSRETEHNLLQNVRKHTTIPVSESHFVEMDPGTFGQPAMLVERMRGSGEVSALFNGGRNEHLAERVATELCEYIAQLHMADPKLLNPNGEIDDPRGVGIDASSWDRYMDSTFEYYINGYSKSDFDALPLVMDAYLTIRRLKPRPLPLRVVHGDFNPANFLYDEEGHITALIDWENSRMGDPREDLGWMIQMDVLSNTNIFGSVKVDGGFLGHYNKITGFGVTEDELNYFRLFGTANIAVPVLSALKRRVEREHEELLHLYIIQPSTVSLMAFAQLMGYPIPTGGA